MNTMKDIEDGLFFTYFMMLVCIIKIINAIKEGDEEKIKHYRKHVMIYSAILLSFKEPEIINK
jgi:hypothetical protein